MSGATCAILIGKYHRHSILTHSEVGILELPTVPTIHPQYTDTRKNIRSRRVKSNSVGNQQNWDR